MLLNGEYIQLIKYSVTGTTGWCVISHSNGNSVSLKANSASPTFTGAVTFSGTVSGITSTTVGLGNCENTTDAAKPVSTATQNALELKANSASPTFTGTVSAPIITTTETVSAPRIKITANANNNRLIFYAGSSIDSQVYMQYYNIFQWNPCTVDGLNSADKYIKFDTECNIKTMGYVEALSFKATSDYRIKSNVEPITDTIDNIKPIKYYNSKSQKTEFGVIAHELQEVFPDLVTGTKDGKDMQSVNYIGLIAILIKEVQELKKEVQELKKDIALLKLNQVV